MWLLACLLIGLGIGVAGHHLTGVAEWFLAVPGAIAVGWLFLANPEACLLPPEAGGHGGSCLGRVKPPDQPR